MHSNPTEGAATVIGQWWARLTHGPQATPRPPTQAATGEHGEPLTQRVAADYDPRHAIEILDAYIYGDTAAERIYWDDPPQR